MEIKETCYFTIPCQHLIHRKNSSDDEWEKMRGDKIARIIRPEHPMYKHFEKYLDTRKRYQLIDILL